MAVATEPKLIPAREAVAQAADYLSIPVESLRKLIARREIAYHQAEKGCRILLRRSDLDTWISTYRIATR